MFFTFLNMVWEISAAQQFSVSFVIFFFINTPNVFSGAQDWLSLLLLCCCNAQTMLLASRLLK